MVITRCINCSAVHAHGSAVHAHDDTFLALTCLWCGCFHANGMPKVAAQEAACAAYALGGMAAVKQLVGDPWP